MPKNECGDETKRLGLVLVLVDLVQSLHILLLCHSAELFLLV